jgi:hypothetical protein
VATLKRAGYDADATVCQETAAYATKGIGCKANAGEASPRTPAEVAEVPSESLGEVDPSGQLTS